MTREEEKLHQSHLYTNERCNSIDLPDWEEVEWAFQSGMDYADAHPIHYDGKAYLYVLHKGVEQGKKEILDKVCEYIKENLYHAWINTNNGNTYRTQSTELFIKNLKKVMEDEEWK